MYCGRNITPAKNPNSEGNEIYGRFQVDPATKSGQPLKDWRDSAYVRIYIYIYVKRERWIVGRQSHAYFSLFSLTPFSVLFSVMFFCPLSLSLSPYIYIYI